MGNPNPRSIFESAKDHFSWDKYLEQLQLIELSDSEREQASSGISFLRKLLGGSFLMRGSSSGHPFLHELLNSAPVARLRIIRVAQAIHAVIGAEGFDRVKRHLRTAEDPDRFLESASLVSLAYQFQQAGFEICFEPETPVTASSGKTTTKRPDIRLTNKSGEQVFVEVSRLPQSDYQKESGVVFDTIWFAVHRLMDFQVVIENDRANNRQIFHHMLPFARIHPGLKQGDLPEVLEEIKRLAEKVQRTNRFHELILRDKFEIGLSPIYDHSDAEEWAKQRGIEDIVDSPPIFLDEITRVLRTVRREIKQLPTDKPGIIVIPTTGTLMMLAYDPRVIIQGIENEIKKYPNLYCIILTLELCATPLKDPIIVPLNQHRFIKRTRNDQITETILLIRNSGFSLSISDFSQSAILQAFSKCENHATI